MEFADWCSTFFRAAARHGIFYYIVGHGKTRRWRKLKLGRADDVSLADAIAEAERIRSLLGPVPIRSPKKARIVTPSNLLNLRLNA